MKPALRLISDTRPSWVVVARNGAGLDLLARAMHPGGRPDAPVSLFAYLAADNSVEVRECNPRQWPVGCPERHINKSGSFCLGVGEANRPTTLAHARCWWSWLHDFILGQRFADRFRRWPTSRALHHGDAHFHQLNLENLAAGTPFECEVAEALEVGSGWLAGAIPRLTREGTRLVNQRAPCPRGCVKRRKPILRRACKQKELIFKLVREERARRREDARFWAEFKGRTCCETMDVCPLAGKTRE